MDKRIGKFLLLFLCLALPRGLESLSAQKTMIYLEHSEQLVFDETVAPDCQKLVGNVKFRHDSAYMFCDTAYFFNKSNFINARGNIRIEQGDTLFVYGDRLFYDGNTRLARLRDNVRMENRSATLYTDSLNYDRLKNVGYYFVWGKLVDSTNVLTSINGNFYPDYDIAVFQHDVVLTTSDGVLNSDTLRYNTKTGMARIVGPSTIVHDSTTVYSERGWYDTKRDYSQLLDNSVITDADGRTLTADTIFYDHKLGFAECRENAVLRDTTENVMLKGNYGFYDEVKERGYMIKRATFIEHSQADSMYMTADTLFFASVEDGTDVWGNYNVQAYQVDFQALCDSMYYTSRDSIMRLYGTPVFWSDKNQITGDSIYMYSANQKIDMVDVIGNAFVFMEIESTAYNQVAGKTVRAYMQNNRVRKIHAEGNAMSVYFVEEERDSTAVQPQDSVAHEYIGINKAESSELIIFVDKENKPERITMLPASSGVMYPPEKQGDKEKTVLQGFLNCNPLRPKDKDDIYVPKDKAVLQQAAEEKLRFKRKER